MYIVSAIPLTFVPRQEAQVFTYFFSEKLERGQLATAPIGNREATVLVLGAEDVEDKKAEIRKASFKLRGISDVFNENTVVSQSDLAFYKWMSQYYFSPIGFIAKTALPPYLLKRPDLTYKASEQREGPGFSFSYSQSPLRFAQYTKVIEENTHTDRQTLVLFPEVLDAERFYERLPSELQDEALLWESSQTPKQEYVARKRLLDNEVKTVVGTRSSALLSLPWLASIIVEGEENDAHVSWDKHPKYDARRIALWRGKTHDLQLFFGSAVPSVALYRHAREAEAKLEFKNRSRKEATTHIIDMREEIRAGNASPLSRRLQEGLGRVREGNQALLLINRRGHYTVILCRDCGHTLRCTQCDSALITMRDTADLVCRQCGTHHSAPQKCPECKSVRFRSFGAGTQRVVEEIEKLFPKLKVGRLDSDGASSLAAQRRLTQQFNDGKLDVLVGTQMMIKPRIVAPVHLAAVVSLEASLLLPEYNGTEQAYQLASKLRMMAKDVFVWQTYQPDHDVFSYFADPSPERFLKETLERREKFGWPPAAQLVTLTIRTKGKRDAQEKAEILYNQLEKVRPQGVTVFDPLPAHTSRVRGRYVWEILLKIEPTLSLKERNEFLSYVPSKWEVVIDPISTLN